MFTLIFALLFGIVFAFFASQNTNTVTITLANTPLTGIHLWVIILVSVVIGLICASYFNVLNIITSTFKLHSKDSVIKGADKTIANLKKEIQNLKAENSNLRSTKNSA